MQPAACSPTAVMHALQLAAARPAGQEAALQPAALAWGITASGPEAAFVVQETMSGLLSDCESSWTPQKSMGAVRSRLQTALASGLGIRPPQLLAVLQVRAAAPALRCLCSCKPHADMRACRSCSRATQRPRTGCGRSRSPGSCSWRPCQRLSQTCPCTAPARPPSRQLPGTGCPCTGRLLRSSVRGRGRWILTIHPRPAGQQAGPPPSRSFGSGRGPHQVPPPGECWTATTMQARLARTSHACSGRRRYLLLRAADQLQPPLGGAVSGWHL